MAASTQCVFLGLKDEPVEGGTTSWLMNKVGGVPDWTTSALKSLPELICPLCSKRLLLALQIYSPLDKCDWYHRTIYVFCCINPSCWNKQESWKVIRSQECSARAEESSSCSAAKPPMSTDWLVGQDDWDDDSWGDESPHHQAHSNNSSQNLEACLGSITVTSPTVASNALPSSEEASNDSEMEEEIPVQAESLESNRALEAMSALKSSEGERKALLRDLQQVSSFKSFHIAVVEESTLPGETPADIRARKLLQDYEAGEGNVFRMPGKGQGSTAYAQETYEKPQYSDTTFHRFHKRLQCCPQQLIRFCWEGEPLFIAEPSPSWQPGKCESCGARRCFELQAMPALIQSLEVEGITQLQVQAAGRMATLGSRRRHLFSQIQMPHSGTSLYDMWQ
ncbi:programmed cell death protein 2-like isoform X3 [Amblyomma americanum]